MTMRRFASRLTGLPAAALAAWLASVGGCKVDTAARPACVTDNQCDPTFACTGGMCIPRGVAQGSAWAIELVPRSDSNAATTQIATQTFSGDTTTLVADAKVTVTGSLAAGSALAGSSHVAATVQTSIGGYTDLQYWTDWSVPAGTGTIPPFSLVVPASAIGKDATFQISPFAPRDQAQPPVTIQAKLQPSLDLTIVSNFYFVTGHLASPDALQGPFVAHALEAGQLVSNVASVNSGGGQFRLAIPVPSINPAAGRSVTIEVVPAGSQYTTPRVVTPTIVVRGNVDVGALTLPAIADARKFRFKVADLAGQPVVGATVRVRTVLASDDHGTADFVREGMSDLSGNADLSLIPGTSDAPQNYDISVIPPPSSPSGVSCTGALPISGPGQDPSGAGDPPVVADLSLPPKVTLSGTISSADGQPVAGVAISATRTAADPSSVCPSSIASPLAGASTGKDGTFLLMVDPGTYSIDYDPPAGSSVPRLTETVVVSSDGDQVHAVRMLPGALIKGSVLDVNGNALSAVAVRFFQTLCTSQSDCFGSNRVGPILSAETHTADDGTFRAVVPVLP